MTTLIPLKPSIAGLFETGSSKRARRNPPSFTFAQSDSPQDRVKKVIERLEAQVKKIIGSQGKFRDWLRTQARFHNYSFGNTILIQIQHPNATLVAGFNDWKRQGRNVKSGEKGIAILAPIRVKRRKVELTDSQIDDLRTQLESDGLSGEDLTQAIQTQVDKNTKSIVVRVGFRVVYVYDVSQTEGKPLPAGAANTSLPALTGDDLKPLLNRLTQYAKSKRGLRVSTSEDKRVRIGVFGYWAEEQNLLWYDPKSEINEATSTVIHELAHERMHRKAEFDYRLHRGEAETQAEAVAHAVAWHYGYDTGAQSFPYIATWAKDSKLLRASLDQIAKHIDAMIGDIGKIEGLGPQIEMKPAQETGESQESAKLGTPTSSKGEAQANQAAEFVARAKAMLTANNFKTKDGGEPSNWTYRSKNVLVTIKLSADPPRLHLARFTDARGGTSPHEIGIPEEWGSTKGSKGIKSWGVFSTISAPGSTAPLVAFSTRTLPDLLKRLRKEYNRGPASKPKPAGPAPTGFDDIKTLVDEQDARPDIPESQGGRKETEKQFAARAKVWMMGQLASVGFEIPRKNRPTEQQFDIWATPEKKTPGFTGFPNRGRVITLEPEFGTRMIPKIGIYAQDTTATFAGRGVVPERTRADARGTALIGSIWIDNITLGMPEEFWRLSYTVQGGMLIPNSVRGQEVSQIKEFRTLKAALAQLERDLRRKEFQQISFDQVAIERSGGKSTGITSISARGNHRTYVVPLVDKNDKKYPDEILEFETVGGNITKGVLSSSKDTQDPIPLMKFKAERHSPRGSLDSRAGTTLLTSQAFGPKRLRKLLTVDEFHGIGRELLVANLISGLNSWRQVAQTSMQAEQKVSSAKGAVEFELPVASLYNRFNSVRLIAATDESRPTLHGIHFSSTGRGTLDMVTADGFMLAVNSDAINPIGKGSAFTALLLHKSKHTKDSVNEWMKKHRSKKSQDGMARVRITPDAMFSALQRAQFGRGSAVVDRITITTGAEKEFVIEGIEGTYPQYTKLIPSDPPDFEITGVKISDLETVAKGLKFVNDKEHGSGIIRLVSDGQGLSFGGRVEKGFGGKVESKAYHIPIIPKTFTFTGEDGSAKYFQLALNLTFLNKLVKSIKTSNPKSKVEPTVDILGTTPSSPLLIRIGKNFITYVIMPMFVNWEKTGLGSVSEIIKEAQKNRLERNPKKRATNPSLSCPSCGATITGNPGPGKYHCSGCRKRLKVVGG